jgi:hypothetical protein
MRKEESGARGWYRSTHDDRRRTTVDGSLGRGKKKAKKKMIKHGRKKGLTRKNQSSPDGRAGRGNERRSEMHGVYVVEERSQVVLSGGSNEAICNCVRVQSGEVLVIRFDRTESGKLLATALFAFRICFFELFGQLSSYIVKGCPRTVQTTASRGSRSRVKTI